MSEAAGKSEGFVLRRLRFENSRNHGGNRQSYIGRTKISECSFNHVILGTSYILERSNERLVNYRRLEIKSSSTKLSLREMSSESIIRLSFNEILLSRASPVRRSLNLLILII